MRILVPFGTRPEIIKLAPVVTELAARGHRVRCVATGQHDSPGMRDQFLDELGLRPDRSFRLPTAAADRLGSLLSQAAALLDEEGGVTDLVLVLGDTFTVPLFAMAARRARTPVAHVEAGLRSLNPTSMEEVNRRVGASCAALHLAPTGLAASLLRSEGVPEPRIRVVGNPVIDALRGLGVARVAPPERRGVLVTAHRATNVDDPDRLRALVRMVRDLASAVGPVTFPLHPRTADRLAAAGLDGTLRGAPGVEVVEPLPYRALLEVLARSVVAVTDSGGIQEEASWFGVPVVVLRRSTPRWEGVVAGSAVLVGVDAAAAVAAARAFAEPAAQQRVASLPCPYGDGQAAGRIADVLEEPGMPALLAIDEPDYRAGLPTAVAQAVAAAGPAPSSAARPAPATADGGADG